MVDKYANFAALLADNQEGVSFAIDCTEVAKSFACVIAPHAGKIETMTGEIAKKIAYGVHSCYVFSGLKPSDNRDLHITSHHFDEPRALAVLAKSVIALGIHGRKDIAHVDGVEITDKETVFIGGLDLDLVEHLAVSLNQNFKTLKTGHRFMAQQPSNVCNLGSSKKGAQIEIPLSLRNKIREVPAVEIMFVDAVRSALLNYNDAQSHF